jgi:signal transduction histidine kinase
MPVTRGISIISDSRRDAEKYSKLLLAIESATGKIGALEKEGRASIDEVLDSLLPDLVEALDAAQAFVAVHQLDNKSQAKGFDLAAVYPKMELSESFLPWSKQLDQVLSDGRARVVEPFEDAPKKLIPGLEVFQAVTAILVRMQVGDQSRIVGVCNRTQSEKGPFLATDRRALESIIGLIAIGLRMGERRRQELEAVINASKVITASVGLSRQEILERILKQAVETIKGSGARKATCGTMQLVDEKNKELVFECAYPPDIFSELKVEIGNRLPLEIAKNEGARSGISVRAANNREPQLVHDVALDPDYVVYYAKTRSELAVPLLDEGRLIGVLDVENDQDHAFDEEDMQALQALADMAVVALNNAEQYNEMEKTKDYLLTSQAVAWLGLFGADLQHTIHQKAFSLDNYVSGLRYWHKHLVPPPDGIQDVFRILDGIEAVSNNIRAVQFASQAPVAIRGEAGAYTVIDEELPIIFEKLGSDRSDVEKELVMLCPGIKAAIAPQGLRVALEKLVNNALKAMPGGGHLSVSTKMSGNMINIRIKDTGYGIPEASLPFFLRRVVPKKQIGEGTGTGVLIARFVALSHGGDLVLVSTSSEGTELLIKLPIVQAGA